MLVKRLEREITWKNGIWDERELVVCCLQLAARKGVASHMGEEKEE